MERILVQINLDQPNENVDCVLKKAKKAKVQVASDISADIRKMLNNPNYSDVVFLCKDGVRVYGSRLFLVARSEVLHRMFRNGMAESQLSEITLQELSSTALLPILEFLYTGTLQEHAPKDWRIAYEIVGAAKFFLLEGLELMVFEYLLQGVTKVGVNMEAAAKFLSITVEFVGILGESVKLIARDLVCILKCRPLRLEHLQALTSNAFMYLLKKSKHKYPNPDYLSQEEFLRFKNIVLWCACTEFASDKPLTLHAIPCEIQSILQFFDKKGRSCKLDMTIREVLASSIKKFLPLVDLHRVPPWDILDVIEPMDIIPSSIIMDALRSHAFYRPPSTTGGATGWSTSFNSEKIYTMNRDGSAIKQTAPGIGFARYNWGMDRPLAYKWEIVVEKVCDGFIEIGLHRDCGDHMDFESGLSLSGQPGGWALRMEADGIFINRKDTHQVHVGDQNFVQFGKDYSRLAYGKDYGHENSKVYVHLDLLHGTCSFTFNDEKSTLAWSRLPKADFFPAVSLGSGSGGAVRIKFIWNEDEEDKEEEEEEKEEEDDEEREDEH